MHEIEILRAHSRRAKSDRDGEQGPGPAALVAHHRTSAVRTPITSRRALAATFAPDGLDQMSAMPSACQYIAVRLSRRKNGTSMRAPLSASPLTACQPVTTI